MTDVLPNLMDNYNSSIHSTTGKRPNELHTTIDAKVVKEPKKRIVKRAKTMVEHTKKEFTNLQKGDWVRFHVNGEGGQFKRGYKAQWSKRVYRVVSKSKPTNPDDLCPND